MPELSIAWETQMFMAYGLEMSHSPDKGGQKRIVTPDGAGILPLSQCPYLRTPGLCKILQGSKKQAQFSRVSHP